MARAKIDPKAKEKRQKVFLAVGTVLLLGVLAFQGPKTLKMLRGSSPPAAATATTTPTDTTSTAGTAAPSTPASGELTSLSDSAAAFPRGVDKLARFTRFSAKDPFEQQVDDTAAASTGTTTGTPSVQATPSASSGKTAAPAPVFGTVEGKGKAATGQQSAKLPTATLRVNGKATQVALGKSFPAARPAFRLAGFAPGSVEILVVGGSLADGSTTLTLRRGRPVTLVNTVDGGRYTLELLSTSRTAA